MKSLLTCQYLVATQTYSDAAAQAVAQQYQHAGQQPGYYYTLTPLANLHAELETPTHVVRVYRAQQPPQAGEGAQWLRAELFQK